MSAILQRCLPYDVDAMRPLPGIAPLDPATWLHVDDAFGAQMAERARLLAEARADVMAVSDGAQAAMDELLQYVLDWLGAHGDGYEIGTDSVLRPDGARVPLDRADPMGTLGHLVQEDLCLMERQGDEHVLTAAVLCFPASWRLADKIGRPLTAIHVPVLEYDAGLARRVQRLFDGVQSGRPLWRVNALHYADPDLHQPRSRLRPTEGADHRYLRSERQCVLRLPRTRACVFSIHTYVIDRVRDAAPGAARD
ncbi:heme-dependent oxidative N-demethylase family protein [Roseovarius sp. D22-M7]|uniref:heme-dependent oxidative N-demethylase family protein n=1 Tax=Roseovarius sp. D22-M7 TaxID=3127116 RepID=UPI00300F8DA1